ncbi:MAG: tail fiber domain-containing protein, partial [Flavobacteriales bacterium]|nr:tail fiber domain-containing protein [Flavobacteriales bacterium]
LQIISNVRGVTFSWKENKTTDFGFIAEEIGKELPNIVEWEEKGTLNYNGVNIDRYSREFQNGLIINKLIKTTCNTTN